MENEEELITDVRLKIFTAVTVVFWDVTACGSCKNRRFGGTHRLQYSEYFFTACCSY
jgi:hypothetical protein